MQAIVTPDEMRAVDAAASVPEDILIQRAGWATATAALRMMGGAYGRRVTIVAGKGNNGADGKVAGEILQQRGARVLVVAPGDALPPLMSTDLVIDAAFGTGFRGEYEGPYCQDVPVLAVDIPSGVDGESGVACSGAVRADATVTFAARKPGLLLADGPRHAGRVEVADIGLDVSGAHQWLIDDDDVVRALGSRPHESHKWKASVLVVAGSPGMQGAAALTSWAAMRSGAGMVHLASPGVLPADMPAGEVVSVETPSNDWANILMPEVERVGALVIGPGLGRDGETIRNVVTVLEKAEVPVVIDADALFAVADHGIETVRSRRSPTILTPHDGEFARLAGQAPAPPRQRAVRDLSKRFDAVVLAKGSTTIVAAPGEPTLFSATGSSRLATAGTGDVLAGVIGAFCAQGVPPQLAAALGAYVHGSAARQGNAFGLIAGDLPKLIAGWLSRLMGSGREG